MKQQDPAIIFVHDLASLRKPEEDRTAP